MSILDYVILFVVGVPVFALAFSATTLFLGLFSENFKVSGDGGLKLLYLKFLIIAAIYLVCSFVGVGGLLGLAVMALAYKFVFCAGWVQALGIGFLGGIVGWFLYFGVIIVLEMTGLITVQS